MLIESASPLGTKSTKFDFCTSLKLPSHEIRKKTAKAIIEK
jgi:hypothetical protein